MEVLTALVRTRYFPEKIKSQAKLLESYVTDYADCSIFVLDRLGYHRYRQLCEYVSGEKEPDKLIAFLKSSSDKSFFCNESNIGITLTECERASIHPHEYALVLYNCFN